MKVRLLHFVVLLVSVALAGFHSSNKTRAHEGAIAAVCALVQVGKGPAHDQPTTGNDQPDGESRHSAFLASGRSEQARNSGAFLRRPDGSFAFTIDSQVKLSVWIHIQMTPYSAVDADGAFAF
jgi:hypothetical protein